MYVACECRCISGRPFSPPGSKKSDDQKYACVGRLRCKNLGTFSLPRTFFCVCFFFGSTVLTSLFYVTREVLTPKVSQFFLGVLVCLIFRFKKEWRRSFKENCHRCFP